MEGGHTVETCGEIIRRPTGRKKANFDDDWPGIAAAYTQCIRSMYPSSTPMRVSRFNLILSISCASFLPSHCGMRGLHFPPCDVVVFCVFSLNFFFKFPLPALTHIDRIAYVYYSNWKWGTKKAQHKYCFQLARGLLWQRSYCACACRALHFFSASAAVQLPSGHLSFHHTLMRQRYAAAGAIVGEGSGGGRTRFELFHLVSEPHFPGRRHGLFSLSSFSPSAGVKYGVGSKKYESALTYFAFCVPLCKCVTFFFSPHFLTFYGFEV